MRLHRDSLFIRLLAIQLIALGVMLVIFVVTVGQGRSVAAALIIAPLWANAVHTTLGTSTSLPNAMSIRAFVAAPPQGATLVRAAYYEVLRDELARYGLQLQSMRTGRLSGRTHTWLKIKSANQTSTWVGIEGNIFGPRQSNQLSLVLLTAIAAVLLMSLFFTWMVVSPLRKLQTAMQAYRQYGRIPAAMEDHASSGPRETRDLARTFVDLAEQRARIDEERELMLASVAHDLRSPLARIRLHAELMPDSADINISKNAIVRNVAIADQHLSSMLEFSMPVSADRVTVIHVDSLCKEIIAQTGLAATDVHIDTPADAAKLTSSLRILTRILVAGLENASKHGAVPIDLRTRRNEEHFIFEIEDNGSGILLAERARMLLPFERGERSRTTPGSGLGLALAAQMARRIGGAIALDQAARGLIYRVSLPIRPLDAE